MQAIREKEVTCVLRSYLRKVCELGGLKQFWMHLREISDLATVVQSITGLSSAALQVSIQTEMNCIFEDVGLTYEFWKTHVLRILNVNSIWQLSTIDKNQFELFLTTLHGSLSPEVTIYSKAKETHYRETLKEEKQKSLQQNFKTKEETYRSHVEPIPLLFSLALSK